MTTVSSIYAGARLTASMLRAIAPLAAYKSADETVSANVGTLQDDDALLLSLDASSVYMWLLFASYSGGALGSSDLLTGWSLPASATALYGALGYNTSGTLAWAKKLGTDTTPFGTSGSGTNVLLFAGTVATSAAAGTMQFEWCQNSGTATATTVHAGSVLAAWKVQG